MDNNASPQIGLERGPGGKFGDGWSLSLYPFLEVLIDLREIIPAPGQNEEDCTYFAPVTDPAGQCRRRGRN